MRHRLGDAAVTREAIERMCIQCGAIERRERKWRKTFGASGKEYHEPAGTELVQALPPACPGPCFYFSKETQDYVRAPAAQAYLTEILAVSKKHGLALTSPVQLHVALLDETYGEDELDEAVLEKGVR